MKHTMVERPPWSRNETRERFVGNVRAADPGWGDKGNWETFVATVTGGGWRQCAMCGCSEGAIAHFGWMHCPATD